MSELTTTARPYARAVFELAKENGTLTEWSDALSFMGAVASDENVASVLDTPTLTREGKAEAFIELCESNIDDKQQNLVKLLAEYGRIEILPQVSTLFEAMKDEEEGSIEATIVSTSELSDEEKDKIATALKARLDRDVKITTEIDKSILGGMIIRAGDMVIDGSIQGRLQKMTHALNG
ncbi:MAG: ATP synthase delta chain (EC [uncultured Thiotrichaceae bacterium]|uniref:ATP synthase subunit delta n=1 Tax=uncultured Thiotrichaceae bacterium TaxID=298394 RepID=A0A6S6T5M3_9GAMM|nr:MAG: ATP synthase delta chain (EC [uncultured Thiotrichaceae bacterium]